MTTRATTARRRVGSAAQKHATEGAEVEPLSPAQIRELRRRVRDLEDRTRYLIASVFIPRSFVLYYDVAGDTYLMNEPAGQLMKCRITKRGKLVKSSLIAIPQLRRARRITMLGD